MEVLEPFAADDPKLPHYPNYPCEKDCPSRGKVHFHAKTKYLEPFIMPPDLVASLDAAKAEWKRLEEAGTPYWCIHKRSVTHERAYSKPDTYPGDGIHRKHGVMCADCGGYIQEG